MIQGCHMCQAWFVHRVAMLLFQIALLSSIFWKHFHYYLPHPFSGVQVTLTGLTSFSLPFLKMANIYFTPFSGIPAICHKFIAEIIKEGLTSRLTSSLSTHMCIPICTMNVPIGTMCSMCSICSLIWSSSTEQGPPIHLEIYPLKHPI